jgi:MinD-like ATPase involved in chromosome partitioning or flagellar assembly
MTRVTLCSAKGSPGVTTLSCVLGAVWPAERSVVVAECDPSGGDIAGRFGLSTGRGMTSLVLTHRQGPHGPVDRAAHLQQLPGGLDVLVGPVGADSATALDREIGLSLSALGADQDDLLADCGRLLPGAIGQEKMIRGADAVLLLVRPDMPAIAHARWATSRIRELSSRSLSVLLIGSGGFKPDEVAGEIGVGVIGTVPFDPTGAAMACGATGTSRAFMRSGLVVSARAVVASLLENMILAESGRRGS